MVARQVLRSSLVAGDFKAAQGSHGVVGEVVAAGRGFRGVRETAFAAPRPTSLMPRLWVATS